MRQYLSDELGIPKDWLRSTGYWKANGSDDEA
jgi:NADPH-dependent ferric siderophore reductase